MENYPPGLSQERKFDLGIEERPKLQLEEDVDDEFWENLTLAQKFELSLKGHLTTREKYDKN